MYHQMLFVKQHNYMIINEIA